MGTSKESRQNEVEQVIGVSCIKMNVDMMGMFRGWCLPRRREAKGLTKDSLHDLLEHTEAFGLFLLGIHFGAPVASHLINGMPQSAFKNTSIPVNYRNCCTNKLCFACEFHLWSFLQVIQQVRILTRLWLRRQSHLMLFNTIEQEFCTTSETKRTNC